VEVKDVYIKTSNGKIKGKKTLIHTKIENFSAAYIRFDFTLLLPT
jgi:hypothetical protein